MRNRLYDLTVNDWTIQIKLLKIIIIYTIKFKFNIYLLCKYFLAQVYALIIFIIKNVLSDKIIFINKNYFQIK